MPVRGQNFGPVEPEGIGQTLRQFKRSTKFVVAGMLLGGAALFAICFKADLDNAEWLESHAYLSNILAGLTGFLIGVPFALVVFAALTREREDKAASRRVQMLSKFAWNRFRDSVEDLCGEHRTEAMLSIANEVKAQHDEVRKGFEEYAQSSRTEEDYRKLQKYVASRIKPWQEPFAQMMRTVGLNHDLRMSWYGVLRDWNTLDQYVRIQRLERGLPWFARSQDSLLQQWMDPEAHPMQQIFSHHEGSKPEYQWRVETMWAALNSLYDYADLNQEQYDFITLINSKYFPSIPLDTYMEAVETAAKNMRQLCLTVHGIDRDDWLKMDGA